MNRFFGIVLLVLLLAPGFVGAQDAEVPGEPAGPATSNPPTTQPTGTNPPTTPKTGETTQGQYVPLTGIPFITQDLLSDGCRDGGDPANCETNLGTVFQGVIIFLIGAGGILAVGYFMWGAIQYMTQDIPSMKQNGREKMLAAVGGLVAVLAAFTLLQTIAPGISDSIKNFNDYLKPVNPPDCLDSATGCLNAQGEGTFNTPVTEAPTEDVPDTPPTSTGNAGEQKVNGRDGKFVWLVKQNTVSSSDDGPLNAMREACDKTEHARKDSAYLAQADKGFNYFLHICSYPLEIKMGPPPQDKQTEYYVKDPFDYIKEYSTNYKAFAKRCEADQVSYLTSQQKTELEGNSFAIQVVKGRVKTVAGVGEQFSAHAGKYSYYLQAIFVCELLGT